MRDIPKIEEVMTISPQTIDCEQPASQARSMLRDLGIRHLPVMRGSQCIGILSERDLAVCEYMEQQLQEVVRVRDVCTMDMYSVTPETPLDIVLEQMAQQGIGSVVVIDAGTLRGIYTTVDACQGYTDLLRSQQLTGS